MASAFAKASARLLIISQKIKKFLEIMAHVKAGGTSKNLRDSQPQYRGIKLSDGQKAKAGSIIVRQKGVKVWAGKMSKWAKTALFFL